MTDFSQSSADVDQSSPTWGTLHAPASENVLDVIHSNASPFLTDRTLKLRLWSLSDAGLYYSADALGTPAWVLKQALTDYVLLRHVAGVSGGQSIAMFGASISTGAWTSSQSCFS